MRFSAATRTRRSVAASERGVPRAGYAAGYAPSSTASIIAIALSLSKPTKGKTQ